jgi:hypothetical protein
MADNDLLQVAEIWRRQFELVTTASFKCLGPGWQSVGAERAAAACEGDEDISICASTQYFACRSDECKSASAVQQQT